MKSLKLIVGIGVIALISCGGDKGSSTPSSGEVGNGKDKTAVPATSSAKPITSTSTNRKGKLVYKQYCVTCHGMDGTLNISGAKDLSISTISHEEALNQVTNGKGLMTPYKDILSEEQIQAVIEYIEELKQ